MELRRGSMRRQRVMPPGRSSGRNGAAGATDVANGIGGMDGGDNSRSAVRGASYGHGQDG